jgi:hypothetical protein
MTSDTFHCQYPAHEGERLVANPLDRYTQRVTYMRLDGKRRLHERSTIRLCRTCVEIAAREEGATDEQMAMILE